MTIKNKKIRYEKEGLQGLKSLVEVYEEVAASRMQKVRGEVIIAREYLDKLRQVFGEVRKAYKKKMEGRVFGKNGKTLAVFVAANSGLYGDIVDRVYEGFSSYVNKNKPEAMILGKLGIKMAADRKLNALYNYFDFADDKVDKDSFAMVMRYVLQFEKVVVFHGRFKSILSQEAVVTDISASTSSETENTKQEEGKKIDYLFEPTLSEIARIFEGQVLTSIFEQTLHESQLAKFASRMSNLDQAMDNIGKRLNRIDIEELRLRHWLQNRKQQARMGGLSLWG